MKLAFECPTPMLDDIQVLGDYDFILAHLVLKDPVYAKWYRESSRKKILDNSTNELLEPCTFEEIQAAADIVIPDLIVAPDYLGDTNLTLKSVTEALTLWPLSKILPVVQGQTLEECKECLSSLDSMGFLKIAIPYDITCERLTSLETMGKTRSKIVQVALSLGFKKIHLLGFTTLEELWSYRLDFRSESIDWSIDTGKPILYGLEDKDLDTVNKEVQGEPTLLKIGNTPPGLLIDKMARVYRNIAILRQVISGIGYTY